MVKSLLETTARADQEVARASDDVSLFGIAAALLRHRRTIVTFALLLAITAAVPVALRQRQWTSSAAFVPVGSESSPGGLQSLAGQFGISLRSGGAAAQSPEFYEELVTSRSILAPIVGDTVAVAEEGGRRRPVLDLLEVDPGPPPSREDEGVRRLRELLSVSLSPRTGVVRIAVTTPWASVSHALADRVVQSLNRFNLQTRQSQAAAERRFVEERLQAQRTLLGASEGRLATFLRTNRQFANSPDLMFEHERLQRDVALQQQVLTQLAQSYEEARLREVRDLPVVALVEPPSLPTQPDTRGLGIVITIGALVGALTGVVVGFLRDGYARRRAAGDADAAQFAAVLGDLRRTFGLGRKRGRVDPTPTGPASSGAA